MAPRSTGRPNVIFFLSDQQRWDNMGIHGNPLDLAPNFDRTARQGTHLANTFTCQPVCAPARSSLQTGLYATNTGVWRNDLSLPVARRTLAHHFRAAGYTTGYVGKWHLVEHKAAGAVAPEQRGGYEYWLASNVLEFTSDAYDTIMYNNDGQPVRLPGYRADAVTDAAIRYIDANQNRPFFLFVSPIEPHFQNHRAHFTAPDGYAERYANRWIPPDLAALGGSTQQHIPGYYGMVKRVDECLGRLLDAVKSLGLSDKTIIVFTSDHGSHFETRPGYDKRSCHESSIRVPAAITGPGFVGGGRLQQLVSLIDLPPTLLDAAGLPVPPEMQGRSIMPLIRHEPVDWPGEVFIQISESQVGRAIRTQRWKYNVVAKDKDGWQHASSDRYTEDCLYDLYADPYELANLIGFSSHRGVVQVLRQRLIRRMLEAGEEEPMIEPAPQRASHRKVLPEELYA